MYWLLFDIYLVIVVFVISVVFIYDSFVKTKRQKSFSSTSQQCSQINNRNRKINKTVILTIGLLVFLLNISTSLQYIDLFEGSGDWESFIAFGKKLRTLALSIVCSLLVPIGFLRSDVRIISENSKKLFSFLALLFASIFVNGIICELSS